jgi:hypothetical protein
VAALLTLTDRPVDQQIPYGLAAGCRAAALVAAPRLEVVGRDPTTEIGNLTVAPEFQEPSKCGEIAREV